MTRPNPVEINVNCAQTIQSKNIFKKKIKKLKLSLNEDIIKRVVTLLSHVALT